MPTTHRTLFVTALLSCPLAAQAGWAVPNFEAALNSTAADTGRNLSFNGLTLHFASSRSGNWELYSSTRLAPGAPWSSPVQEVLLGGTTVEDQPCRSGDGLEIYFSSTNRTRSPTRSPCSSSSAAGRARVRSAVRDYA